VQELVGLPSALIDVAADAGIPTLMTLQDYFPLCATIRLWDADGRLCTRLQVGQDCIARNAGAPRDAHHLTTRTLDFELGRIKRAARLGSVDFSALAPVLTPTVRALSQSRRPKAKAAQTPVSEPTAGENTALAASFQRRRDLNVDRLGRVDRLIAQSPRVAEIYANRGVATDRLRTLPFTLSHIARLRPRSMHRPPERVTFATLNGCVSPTKGAHVVAGAVRVLRDRGLTGRFVLRVYGHVDREVRAQLCSTEGVELRGPYERSDLDHMLDDVDVGLMPSVWEEAFGYTGLEMIAKGVPLIANPVGGIVGYARDGETSWHNTSCSAEGMADHMGALIESPDRIVEMHRRLMRARDDLVAPIDRHIAALERNYEEIVAQRSRVR
jgi:glycosyltransferase involved in cell wall biosynthesis